jgi:glycosylphosphatidylinositol transamidase (GPIT) subunit GPI8
VIPWVGIYFDEFPHLYLQAYQVLRKGGIPDDHIVLMIQDDLAHSEFNPHPGKIFNKPGGPDVYQGVKAVSSYAKFPLFAMTPF